MAAELTVVLGAGAAGLTAAWELARRGRPVLVIEQEQLPGGLCRTFEKDGYRFDLGGHRFLSNDEVLARDVGELLGKDLLEADRRSVILLEGKRYRYPLEALDLAKQMGLWAGAKGFAAYLRERVKPSTTQLPADSFEAWAVARYGRRFYQLFFGPYTEKLWGVPPAKLSGDWASQRLSLLDLSDVALRLLRLRQAPTRTYARRYFYPREGIGQIFRVMAQKVEALGGTLRFGTRVTGLSREGGRLREIQVEGPGGTERISCQDVISTLPLPDLARLVFPEDSEVSQAAKALRFRPVRFLNILLDRDDVSPNTWVYVADPRYLATRIQEPKRRSPESAPPGKTSLMLEIPCDPEGWVWKADDQALLDRCLFDLDQMDLKIRKDVRGCFSTRITHGYPVFQLGYQAPRDALLRKVGQVANLVSCGRQGTFRYIFMDTAMQMGRKAALALADPTGQGAQEIAFLDNEPNLREVRAVTA